MTRRVHRVSSTKTFLDICRRQYYTWLENGALWILVLLSCLWRLVVWGSNSKSLLEHILPHDYTPWGPLSYQHAGLCLLANDSSLRGWWGNVLAKLHLPECVWVLLGFRSICLHHSAQICHHGSIHYLPSWTATNMTRLVTFSLFVSGSVVYVS